MKKLTALVHAFRKKTKNKPLEQCWTCCPICHHLSHMPFQQCPVTLDRQVRNGVPRRRTELLGQERAVTELIIVNDEILK